VKIDLFLKYPRREYMLQLYIQSRARMKLWFDVFNLVDKYDMLLLALP